jgi:DNA-binding SARP family transcriptional activator/tetratricopeptide (TPR) repeat protein
MRFGVLGPLSVEAGQDGVRLDGPRQAKVLAALLLEANRTVEIRQLISAMWDGDEPATAVRQVQDAVSGLRRILGARAAGQELISTHGRGYRINVAGDRLDLLEFEAHVRRARKHLMPAAASESVSASAGQAEQAGQTDRAEAAEALRAALGCWRGPALAGLDNEFLAAGAARLDDRRLDARRRLLAVELELDHHREVVGDLLALIQEHPFDEWLTRLGMLALYRCGRRAQCLAVYHDLRRRLVDELGVEPGQDVQALHQQVLHDDPGLLPPRGGRGSGPGVRSAAPPAPTPAGLMQLPADTRIFTGRTGEVDNLVALADAAVSESGGPGTVVISAIDGMAGIGKTALAVHAAHRIRDSFPDGQLFIDLHGYTPGVDPLTASDALGFLLRSLGVAQQLIPVDLEERAALYRTRLRHTRTLIVLDNAASAAQLRPLVPGSPGSLVLVTSRRRLTGLDEAHSLALDILPEADAVSLLHRVAGPGRIAPDDPAIPELLALCGRVPLAVRITAARLRHRRTLSIDEVLGQLRDEHSRLSSLADEDRSVPAAFEASYTSLTTQEQHAFRLLGAVPGPDFDAHAAASLLDTGYREAERTLESLLDQNLLAQHTAGRYRFHDLVRVYARSLAGAEPAGAFAPALDRLFDYYQHTARTTDFQLTLLTRPGAAGEAVPPSVPRLGERAEGLAWLRAERDNIAAAIARAEGTRRATTLTAALSGLLDIDGPWTTALELHRTAAAVARDLGDRLAEANARLDLARLRRLTGDFAGADESYRDAMAIYLRIGEPLGEANALNELARLAFESGDYQGSIALADRASELHREVGDRIGDAAALVTAGRALGITDRDAGTERQQRAYALYRDLGHRLGEANGLWTLAAVAYAAGRYQECLELLEQALPVYRAARHRQGEASTLSELGRVQRKLGRYESAVEVIAQALSIFREMGHRPGELNTLAALAEATRLLGDYEGALAMFGLTAEGCHELGHRHGEADARFGLGLTQLALKNLQAAEGQFEQALGIYAAIDHPQGQAEVLNGIGDLMLEKQEPAEALRSYEKALAHARDAHSPSDEARALAGSARALAALGDRERALRAMREATAVYRRLELPEAEPAAAYLAELERGAGG